MISRLYEKLLVEQYLDSIALWGGGGKCMRFLGKPVQGTSVALGALIAVGACVLPVVSGWVSPVIAGIRKVIGGSSASAGGQ